MLIAKVIKAEVCQTDIKGKTIYARKITMSISVKSVSGTLQLLLHKVFTSLNPDSLTSLLNMGFTLAGYVNNSNHIMADLQNIRVFEAHIFGLLL